MSFTPGPWEYIEGAEEVVWHDDGDELVICEFPIRKYGEKNGRLIAAAPELLEACEAAFSLLVSNAMYGNTMSKLEAAIKKARGQ